MGRITVEISPDPSLEDLLARRGLRYTGQGNETQIIKPQVANSQMSVEYHKLLGHYTFRKILRLIAAKKDPVHNEEILSMCSEPTLRKFREFLVNSGIVGISEDNSWSLKVKVDNFGYTLEWYVWELLSKKLGAIGGWNVKIEGLLAGGDFDVLAFVDSVLIYVECKSKRPEEIDDSEVRNFLQRSQDLAPELAIMLIDTDSELDTLLNRFDSVLLRIQRIGSGTKDPNWKPEKPSIAKVAGFNNIYFGLQRIFLTHSQPSILHALQDCLRHYHTHVKFASFLSGTRVNYITEEIIND